MTRSNDSYTARDIEVLEGLEPVRKRPAMYIGGTASRGYHHLLWEIVDNSVDEVINGHASKIQVTIDADGKGATVTDDGRGIPVDQHPRFKRPALEIILCTLHAGGKFTNGAYKVSGGLHGVGASVVNALSEHLEVRVCREEGVDCIDLASMLPKDTTVFYDHCHFNIEGCRKIAGILLDFFVKKEKR